MRCQQCRGIDFTVIESRITITGTRRRRWQCRNCGLRWTTRQADAAPSRPRRQSRPRIRGGNRTLTNAQAAAIMLSESPIRQLAADYGMTHQSIALIRSGRSYRDVFAALGLNRNGCHSCRYWLNHACSFAFPEAGGTFSKDCTLYEPIQHR